MDVNHVTTPDESLGEDTDWAALWRHLVTRRIRCLSPGSSGSGDARTDPWQRRARDYDELVRRRWAEPDTSRQFVLSELSANDTLLDVGAGTGAWSALAAPRVAGVTAVEPSPAMAGLLREKLAARDIGNVRIIEGWWPEVDVDPHDVSLCAHAMYWSADLEAFVGRMVACTRRTCILIVRAHDPGGILAEASLRLFGSAIDGPNLVVASNVLHQMGIRAQVLMERGGAREPRQSSTLEEALGRVKRHLGLCDATEHDGYLLALLRRRLSCQGGRYLWPLEGGSGLLSWSVR